jgi:class 3 adenylate cyclase
MLTLKHRYLILSLALCTTLSVVHIHGGKRLSFTNIKRLFQKNRIHPYSKPTKLAIKIKSEYHIPQSKQTLTSNRLSIDGSWAINRHEAVILFSQIDGWKSTSNKSYASDFNSIIRQLDSKIKEFGPTVKRIKTTGNVIMLEVKQGRHSKNYAKNNYKATAIKVAHTLHSVVIQYNHKNNTKLIVKIGMAAGPVTGGYLCKDNSNYDVFGDVVNQASRIKSPKDKSETETHYSFTRCPEDVVFSKIIQNDMLHKWNKNVKTLRPKGLKPIKVYEGKPVECKNTKANIQIKCKPPKPKQHHAVIITTDIKGFTKLTNESEDKDIIEFLAYMFRRFDTIIKEHSKTRRIETQGDAYKVEVTGSKASEKAIIIAKKFQEAIDRYNTLHVDFFKTTIQMRVGLTSGTVISIPIGLKNPQYKVFGLTVTNAEKLEETCPPGHIQIGSNDYKKLRKTNGIICCPNNGITRLENKYDIRVYNDINAIPEGNHDVFVQPKQK